MILNSPMYLKHSNNTLCLVNHFTKYPIIKRTGSKTICIVTTYYTLRGVFRGGNGGFFQAPTGAKHPPGKIKNVSPLDKFLNTLNNAIPQFSGYLCICLSILQDKAAEQPSKTKFMSTAEIKIRSQSSKNRNPTLSIVN